LLIKYKNSKDHTFVDAGALFDTPTSKKRLQGRRARENTATTLKMKKLGQRSIVAVELLIVRYNHSLRLRCHRRKNPCDTLRRSREKEEQ
jgi:hypothetical protein